MLYEGHISFYFNMLYIDFCIILPLSQTQILNFKVWKSLKRWSKFTDKPFKYFITQISKWHKLTVPQLLLRFHHNHQLPSNEVSPNFSALVYQDTSVKEELESNETWCLKKIRWGKNNVLFSIFIRYESHKISLIK